MKYSKKIFSIIAIAICFSFCMGTVSHAETIIQYRETKFSCPAGDFENVTVTGSGMRIDSSGRLVTNIFGYKTSYSKSSGKSIKRKIYARITYDVKGKKKVNAMTDYYQYSNDNKYIYGSRVYGIDDKKVCKTEKK